MKDKENSPDDMCDTLLSLSRLSKAEHNIKTMKLLITKGSRLVRRGFIYNIRAQFGGRLFIPNISRQRSFLDTRPRPFERSIFTHQTVSLVGKLNVTSSNY